MENIYVIISLMPIFDFSKKTKEDQDLKSVATLHEAIKKAQAILSMAELESIKLVSDARFYKGKLESGFEAKIQEAVTESEKILAKQANEAQAQFATHLEALKQNIAKTQKEYDDYLNYLKTQSDESKNKNQELIRDQINQMFAKFEENLSEFLVQTEQRSVTSIDLELKATRQLIDTYKQQQLKLIDENIIAMLERTLSLVLGKRLSLKEHIDLVYEALEQAKAEKFIV